MKPNAFKNAATLTFSVAFAGAVMAQSPTPQTPQQPPTTPQTTRPAQQGQGQDNLRGMIGQTVTVSGCLTQDRASSGQTTTPGTPGTPKTPGTPGTERTGAASGMASGYVLTNVQMRSGAPTPGATGSPSTTGKPSTPGTTGSMAGAAGGMKIKLKASGTTDLSANVNKRVEVTGRLEAASDTSSTTRTPGTTPGTPGDPGRPGTPGTPETGAPSASARGAMNSMPELQVSNVRVLEQSCTPQQ